MQIAGRGPSLFLAALRILCLGCRCRIPAVPGTSVHSNYIAVPRRTLLWCAGPASLLWCAGPAPLVRWPCSRPQ
eukprot:360823-Chlamydomonas_euryale.AAC.6